MAERLARGAAGAASGATAFAHARVLLLRADEPTRRACRVVLRELGGELGAGAALGTALSTYGLPKAGAATFVSGPVPQHEFVTALVSTVEPVRIELGASPAAAVVGARVHEALAARVQTAAFERSFLAITLWYLCWTQFYLSGVGGAAVEALTWSGLALLSVVVAAVAALCSVDVLQHVVKSYFFWYPAMVALSAIPACSAYALSWHRMYGVVTCTAMLLMPLVDGFSRRTLVWKFYLLCGISLALGGVFSLAGVYLFRPAADTTVAFLGGQVSLDSRLANAFVTYAIVCARDGLLAFFYPDRLFTLPKARLATIPHANGEMLLLAAAKARLRRRGRRVAPEERSAAVLSFVTAVRAAIDTLQSSQPVRPPSKGDPSSEGGAGGTGGLASPAELATSNESDGRDDEVLTVVAEQVMLMLAESAAGARRDTVEVTKTFAIHSQGEGAVQMLLPVFCPTAVDENDTLVKALVSGCGLGLRLGLGRASGPPLQLALLLTQVLAPSRPPAVSALCVSWPLALGLAGAALVDAAPAPAALLALVATILATAGRLLLGSSAVAAIAACEFNLWLVLGTAGLLGLCGCALLGASELSAVWALAHVLLCLVCWSDMLPAAPGWAGRAQRLAFFPAFSLFGLWAMYLLHTGRFPGSEQDARVLTLPISARHTALSAQFSLLTQSLRFAVRAVRTRDHLVVCDGLRTARLTREELRLLEVAAHSVRHFRYKARS
jgi:hypothetical protein